jgi:hypothetical protein
MLRAAPVNRERNAARCNQEVDGSSCADCGASERLVCQRCECSQLSAVKHRSAATAEGVACISNSIWQESRAPSLSNLTSTTYIIHVTG